MQNDCQRELIAGLGGWLPRQNFRGRISDLPLEGTRIRPIGERLQASNPEICHLHFSLRRDEQIGWRKVSVRDDDPLPLVSLLVRVTQTSERLRRDEGAEPGGGGWPCFPSR